MERVSSYMDLTVQDSYGAGASLCRGFIVVQWSYRAGVFKHGCMWRRAFYCAEVFNRAQLRDMKIAKCNDVEFRSDWGHAKKSMDRTSGMVRPPPLPTTCQVLRVFFKGGLVTS